MQRRNPHSVALGLSNNVDYEIEWSTPVIESLVTEYDIKDGDIREYTEVGTEKQLVCSILYYLSKGSGHEVYVSDVSVVEKFASRFKNNVTMGGTSIRAAIAMERMGKSAALHLLTMNDYVRAQMPKTCDFVCSNDHDTSYPHLIIQYKAGTRVRANGLEIVAPLPNRIIYTNDEDSMLVRINEGYAELITAAKIMLVSGFNVVVDRDVLENRIDATLRLINALPEGALVYYESSCFFVDEFNRRVNERLRDKIDIYSMNEEEMQHWLGRSVNLLDPSDADKALWDLREVIGARYVLVHTHLWAAMVGPGASKFDEAVLSASNMATTRFRFGDKFTPEDYASTLKLPKTPEVIAFVEGLERISGENVSVTPVPVIPETEVTTIGLGDSFVGGFMMPFA